VTALFEKQLRDN